MEKKENPIVQINELIELKDHMKILCNRAIVDIMNEVLPLTAGQECMIYKNNRAWSEISDSEVVYIPDIYLNEIYKFWYASDIDVIEPDSYDILIDNCYTKEDFIMIGGERAEELFDFVDWQHPMMQDLMEGDDE